MPINQFSIGKDITVEIITQFGPVTFKNFTEFSSRQTKKKIKSDKIDGVVSHIWIPGGWEGDMMYDRTSSDLDDYFAQEELAYYAGLPIISTTIVEVISEADGSVSSFLYTGVQMEVTDAGKWRGDDKVPQSVSWAASMRQELS